MAKFYALNSETTEIVEFNQVNNLEDFGNFIIENEEKTDYTFMVEFEFYAEIVGQKYILEAGDWYPVE